MYTNCNKIQRQDMILTLLCYIEHK